MCIGELKRKTKKLIGRKSTKKMKGLMYIRSDTRKSELTILKLFEMVATNMEQEKNLWKELFRPPKISHQRSTKENMAMRLRSER